jgi:hypothetical protein
VRTPHGGSGIPHGLFPEVELLKLEKDAVFVYYNGESES